MLVSSSPQVSSCDVLSSTGSEHGWTNQKYAGIEHLGHTWGGSGRTFEQATDDYDDLYPPRMVVSL